jgi:hypothetical protein
MLYFIAHGNQGLISLSDGQAATLDLLSRYKIGDSILHFSTCLTVSDEEAVKRLMEATGALLITGYKSLLYLVDGLIVDLIIITSILRKVKTLTSDSVFKATKFIRNKYEDICKREGFMYCRRGRKQDSAKYIWYNREKNDY